MPKGIGRPTSKFVRADIFSSRTNLSTDFSLLSSELCRSMELAFYGVCLGLMVVCRPACMFEMRQGKRVKLLLVSPTDVYLGIMTQTA